MKVMMTDKKIEAVKRMKMLGIYEETIRQFEEDGKISRSEPPLGAFYWVEGKELDAVKEFEERHNALVYCVIRAYTEIGMMDSYLYVSDHEDEWYMDRENAIHNYLFTYTVNYDAPDCSEFGYVYVERTAAGGLKRIS